MAAASCAMEHGWAPAFMRSSWAPRHGRGARPRLLRSLCSALHRRAAAAAAGGPARAALQAPDAHITPAQLAEAALRATAALAAALVVQLGGAGPAAASAAEDALLQLVRQVEARLESTVEAVTGAASLVSRWRLGARLGAAALRRRRVDASRLTATLCHLCPPPGCRTGRLGARGRRRRAAAGRGGVRSG